MVFFICNHCGESLKKQVVANHAWRCKRFINVSCMDCQKDFTGNAYDAHNVCITEAEKYSAKGFVPKVAKGAQKQESWLSKVRSIPERNKNLSPGVKSVFEIIERNDNIPRKKIPFFNFFKNTNRKLIMKDIEKAWILIEQETANDKQTPVQTIDQRKEASVPVKNGTNGAVKNGENGMHINNAQVKQNTNETNQSSENDAAPLPKKQKKSKNVPENNAEGQEPSPNTQKKRKTKDVSENGDEDEESHPSKQKKCKTTNSSQNGTETEATTLVTETHGANRIDDKAEDEEQNGSEEKFKLSETIRQFLVSRNNQMKLSKLKKKVLKRYQQATGEEVDGKFEKKFQKKIAKSGFVVENNIIRLVEA